MTRDEQYRKRSLLFSQFHRGFSDDFGMIDIDCLEYCDACKEPLALAELAEYRALSSRSSKPITVTRKLAIRAHLPCYRIHYRRSDEAEFLMRRFNRDGNLTREEQRSLIDKLWVQEVYPQRGREIAMSSEDYEQFLRGLRNQHNCPEDFYGEESPSP